MLMLGVCGFPFGLFCEYLLLIPIAKPAIVSVAASSMITGVGFGFLSSGIGLLFGAKSDGLRRKRRQRTG
jgi:hypothetical protein